MNKKKYRYECTVKLGETNPVRYCESKEEFIEHANNIFVNENLRNKLANSARKYAEDNFLISKIAKKFEIVL